MKSYKIEFIEIIEKIVFRIFCYKRVILENFKNWKASSKFNEISIN